MNIKEEEDQKRHILEEMIRQAICNRHTNMKRLTIDREGWRTRFATTRLFFQHHRNIKYKYIFRIKIN